MIELWQLAAMIDPNAVGIPNAGRNADALVNTIINTVIFFFGAVAVIGIIVSGILYTISNGDADKVKRAKNGILYSVVGLVISALAFTIVGFIVSWFGG